MAFDGIGPKYKITTRDLNIFQFKAHKVLLRAFQETFKSAFFIQQKLQICRDSYQVQLDPNHIDEAYRTQHGPFSSTKFFCPLRGKRLHFGQ